MSSDSTSTEAQVDVGHNAGGDDDVDMSQMDDFSSVDFSMTEFNFKDSDPNVKEDGIRIPCHRSKEESPNSAVNSVMDVDGGSHNADIDNTEGLVANCETGKAPRSVIQDGVETVSPDCEAEKASLSIDSNSNDNGTKGLEVSVENRKNADQASGISQEDVEKIQKMKECLGDGMTCAECGKTFSHNFYFGTHIVCHMGEKGYQPIGQCGMCGLVFADLHVHQAHMMSLQTRLQQMSNNTEVDQEDFSNGGLYHTQEDDQFQKEYQLQLQQQQEEQLFERQRKRQTQNLSRKRRTEKEKKNKVLMSETAESLLQQQLKNNKKIVPNPSKNSSSGAYKNIPINDVKVVLEKLEDSGKLPMHKQPHKQEVIPSTEDTPASLSQSPPSTTTAASVPSAEPSVSDDLQENDELLPKKRARKAPVKFESIVEPKAKRARGAKRRSSLSTSIVTQSSWEDTASTGASVDEDPEVERYLQSLRDMGLTVDSGSGGQGGGNFSGIDKRPGQKGGSGSLNNNHSNNSSDRNNSVSSSGGANVKENDMYNYYKQLVHNRDKMFGSACSSMATSLPRFTELFDDKSSKNTNNKIHSGSDSQKRHPDLDNGNSPLFAQSLQYERDNYNNNKNYFDSHQHHYNQMCDFPQYGVPSYRRRMSKEEEDDEVLTLMGAELEVMPKSGKQTRGERLKQRQQRLSQNGEEGSDVVGGKKPRLSYHPPKEESSKLKRSGGGGGGYASVGYHEYLSGFKSGRVDIGGGHNDGGGHVRSGVSNTANKNKTVFVHNVEQDDDEVQIIDVEESSSSKAGSSKPSSIQRVRTKPSFPSSKPTHHQQNYHKEKAVGGKQSSGTHRDNIVKITNLEGNVKKLREDSRKNVEHMLASSNVGLKRAEKDVKVGSLFGKKKLGVENDSGVVCIDDSDDNGGDEDGADEKEIESGEGVVIPILSSLKYCGDAAENKKESVEGGEKEEVLKKLDEGVEVEEEESKGGADADVDILDGEDIEGWTVSISAVSDSEEDVEKGDGDKEEGSKEEDESKTDKGREMEDGKEEIVEKESEGILEDNGKVAEEEGEGKEKDGEEIEDIEKAREVEEDGENEESKEEQGEDDENLEGGDEIRENGGKDDGEVERQEEGDIVEDEEERQDGENMENEERHKDEEKMENEEERHDEEKVENEEERHEDEEKMENEEERHDEEKVENEEERHEDEEKMENEEEGQEDENVENEERQQDEENVESEEERHEDEENVENEDARQENDENIENEEDRQEDENVENQERQEDEESVENEERQEDEENVENEAERQENMENEGERHEDEENGENEDARQENEENIENEEERQEGENIENEEERQEDEEEKNVENEEGTQGDEENMENEEERQETVENEEERQETVENEEERQEDEENGEEEEERQKDEANVESEEERREDREKVEED